MKKILIIKTGTTFASIKKDFGDFDHHIIDQMELPNNNFVVSSVYENDTIPELNNICAIIITGSHSMVTDHKKWSNKLSKWLSKIKENNIPILGICYGHQLLAKTFGGIVNYHNQGKEIGAVNITKTDEGNKDQLFSVLPDNFYGYVTHAQTVVTAPTNSNILAYNSFENHHAIRIYKKIWGVQFHPEFNSSIIKGYIKEQEFTLINEGYNIQEIYNSITDHSYGKDLLKQFINII